MKFADLPSHFSWKLARSEVVLCVQGTGLQKTYIRGLIPRLGREDLQPRHSAVAAPRPSLLCPQFCPRAHCELVVFALPQMPTNKAIFALESRSTSSISRYSATHMYSATTALKASTTVGQSLPQRVVLTGSSSCKITKPSSLRPASYGA